jgi:uncharacterized membrane protein
MAKTPKQHRPWDLLSILFLTALLVTCIAFVPSDMPRIVLGLPFVLFFPGYAFIGALFPRRESLNGVERVALSFGLSLAIVPLLTLALNYLWEISIYPILISVAAFTAIMSGVAYYRQKRLPQHERYEPQINLPLLRWHRLSHNDSILAIALAITAVAAITAVVYTATRPRSTDRFTEFYILGPRGSVEYYPANIVLGASADVTVGIVNREGEQLTYNVGVSLNGTMLLSTDGIALEDGGTWEEAVALTPVAAGDDQKVEFLLYREGESEPYHELRLWIDVRDPSAPP